MEFIFVLNVVYVGGKVVAQGELKILVFLIAHRVRVSDILFLVFREKVI